VNGLRLRLRRRAEKRVTDEQLSKALAALPADHPLRRPHPGIVVGESLLNRGDAGRPTFTPAPRVIKETAPIPMALPLRRGRHTAATAARVSPGGQDEIMKRAWWSLRSLDMEALDAAKKTEGATYAGVRQAAAIGLADPLTAEDWPVDPGEPTRFHDAVAAARPAEFGPNRAGRGEAARRRAEALAYPPCDGTGTAAAYAGVLRLASAITGTDGSDFGQWWRPALESAA
jgi:hypothetical protein